MPLGVEDFVLVYAPATNVVKRIGLVAQKDRAQNF